MGPSGAGKSTLLDILAFRKTTGKWTTDIRLNGALLSKQTFVEESGYVTSDDLLTPELTCREMLRFGAKLRLPADWSESARDQRVRIEPTEPSLRGEDHSWRAWFALSTWTWSSFFRLFIN